MRKDLLGIAVVAAVIGSAGFVARAASTGQDLVALEHTWKQAVIARDAPMLNRLYAEEYLSTDSEGATWNKAQDIEIDTAGNFRVASYKLEDVNVRFYGSVGVVTGRSTLEGTFLGNPARAENRFIDVFIRRDGRWQCVATQTTPIAKE